MSYVSDLLADLWLQEVAKATTFVALHYAEPGLVDPTSTELTGGAYARQQAVMAVNGRSVSNSNLLSWSSLDSSNITHIAVYDGAYSNDLLFYVTLQSPVVVLTNGTFALEIDDLYLRLP